MLPSLSRLSLSRLSFTGGEQKAPNAPALREVALDIDLAAKSAFQNVGRDAACELVLTLLETYGHALDDLPELEKHIIYTGLELSGSSPKNLLKVSRMG
jgi:hypothetical protein